ASPATARGAGAACAGWGRPWARSRRPRRAAPLPRGASWPSCPWTPARGRSSCRLHGGSAKTEESRVADDGEARVDPAAEPADHRTDVRVAHALEAVGGERRAIAAPAVDDDVGGGVGDARLDVPLEHALADVLRRGEVAGRPLALLAHVHQVERVAPLEARPHVGGGDLDDVGPNRGDAREKAGAVLLHRR